MNLWWQLALGQFGAPNKNFPLFFVRQGYFIWGFIFFNQAFELWFTHNKLLPLEVYDSIILTDVNILETTATMNVSNNFIKHERFLMPWSINLKWQKQQWFSVTLRWERSSRLCLLCYPIKAGKWPIHAKVSGCLLPGSSCSKVLSEMIEIMPYLSCMGRVLHE